MPLETIGIRAIVEGLEKYLNDLKKIESSTQTTAKGLSAGAIDVKKFGTALDGTFASAGRNKNAFWDLAAGAKGAGGAAASAGISMASLAAGALIAVPALVAIGKAAIGAANDAMELGLAVADMSDKLGTSAEESSRLIQMADDLRIPTSTLQVAFRNLLQNGIQPTTANLALLGEQYRAILDPVKRAEFAMEKFGARSGLEMTRLLQTSREELTAMTDEHERLNLIMGQDGVQSSKAYYSSLDTLKDAWMGLKIAFGTPVMGSITIAIKTIMQGLGITETPASLAAEDEAKLKAAGLGMGAPGSDTVEEHKALLAARRQYRASILTTRALEREREIRKGIVWTQTDSVALAERQAALETTHEAALENLATAQQQYKAAQQEVLSQAQENMGIVNSLTSEGSGRQIADAKLIDQAYGTNFAKDIERKKAEEKMWRDFHAKRITGEQVLEQLGEQKAGIMDPAIAAIHDAETVAAEFQAQINALTGTTIVITQVCKGYMCPKTVATAISTKEAEALGLGQRATGGPPTGADIVGEHGWEILLGSQIIPHAQSVAMMAAGLFRPKAKHAAGGFIDPASLAFPLTGGRGGNSRVGVAGDLNVAISTDIGRQAFLNALRQIVQ